ncbi:hypothetical protein JZ751_008677 [Albula glossodonta]|uniref:LIM zinc-binding domain-containing protein n=1 Tax=Albula glossodonta TaxID=121402 RepID=A0A8T2NWZ4_9TELE|nr:hypothetical protein JZ751_008677 [Albula glossodonta]
MVCTGGPPTSPHLLPCAPPFSWDCGSHSNDDTKGSIEAEPIVALPMWTSGHGREGCGWDSSTQPQANILPLCGCDLAQGGFFVRQGEYICTLDYQRLYGTRCFSCDEFIEGEVVSALGKTYHPRCFVCAVCNTYTWLSLRGCASVCGKVVLFIRPGKGTYFQRGVPCPILKGGVGVVGGWALCSGLAGLYSVSWPPCRCALPVPVQQSAVPALAACPRVCSHINSQRLRADADDACSSRLLWPFPAGDRVTFNGKECICQKCTQPLPANSPAPIQAVHNSSLCSLIRREGHQTAVGHVSPLHDSCSPPSKRSCCKPPITPPVDNHRGEEIMITRMEVKNTELERSALCSLPLQIHRFINCCGCGKEFKNEQSLVALDKHWHLGCFKCKICNKVLNAEYISNYQLSAAERRRGRGMREIKSEVEKEKDDRGQGVVGWTD